MLPCRPHCTNVLAVSTVLLAGVLFTAQSAAADEGPTASPSVASPITQDDLVKSEAELSAQHTKENGAQNAEQHVNTNACGDSVGVLGASVPVANATECAVVPND